MAHKRRKAPKVQWVIIYHGDDITLAALHPFPVYDTQKQAIGAVDRYVNKNPFIDIERYEVVKYVRA